MAEVLFGTAGVRGKERRHLRCDVIIDNIEVMADIGALAAERGVPQPLRVHVSAEIVPPERDELADTLDYRHIREVALDLAAQRIVLVETFARRLAERCLDCASVLAVEVRVDKPQAVPNCLAAVRVRLSRV